jgi:glutaminyl-tRNA synthetase
MCTTNLARYGRLKLEGTILSKRRITQLVEGSTVNITKPDGSVETKKIPPAVRGWDDPRLDTLVAIRRRGVPAPAIIQFVSELGVTDANTTILSNKFYSVVRRHLERTVPRLMLVLDPIKVVIDDLPDDFSKELKVPYDPKDPNGESRNVPLTKVVYIDRSDFREEDSPDFFRLAPGKAVGLLNAPFAIQATSFSKDANGNVIEIQAKSVEGVKPKAFIHWVGSTAIRVVAREYNALFKSLEPNALDWKEGGYEADLNPESEVVFPNALIEPGLEDVRKSHAAKPDGASDDLVRFQAVRTGYFCIDPESEGDKLVLNQIVSLKEDMGKGK